MKVRYSVSERSREIGVGRIGMFPRFLYFDRGLEAKSVRILTFLRLYVKELMVYTRVLREIRALGG
jgi:hypothetical protein